MIRRATIAIWLLLGATTIAFTQPEEASEELKRLIDATNSQLEDALTRYNELVAVIENEKLDLVRQTNRLEEEILSLQSQQKAYQTAESELNAKSEQARSDLENLEGISRYVDGVLSDYIVSYGNRIHDVELLGQFNAHSSVQEKLANERIDYHERIAVQLDFISSRIDETIRSVGGKRIAGDAISPSGELVSGEYARLGPAAYFSSTDHLQSGIAQYNSGTIEPRIRPLDSKSNRRITDYVYSDANILPIDVTGGKALSLVDEQGGIWRHIAKGGWVGYVILGLGLVAIVLCAYKTLELKAYTSSPPSDPVSAVRDALEQPCEASASGDIFRKIYAAGAKHHKESRELMEESMLATILQHRLHMERFLPFLAVTAATAPLLGLLGTVVGMIKTFTLITIFGTGDARTLSGGISEALVTTEMGLVVAIPVLIAHSMLLRKVKSNSSVLEEAAFEFIKVASKKPIA